MEDLSATAWAVLGLLSFGRELSGYEVRKWADASLRFFYGSPAMSQVYRELRRLEARGYATSRPAPRDEPRRKRLYRITPAGKAALRAWLRDTPVEAPAVRHGAGIVAPALEGVIDVTTWDAVLGTHLRGYAFVVQALVDELRRARPGSAIVGIASIEGLIGHGAIPSYTAAKHGMIGLSRSLAHRLGPEGVRVNAVCPGYIETPMLAPAIGDAAARARLETSVPLGRLGEPADVAAVVRFLLSNEARYIHGAAVVVDGGVTATGGQ